MQKADFIQIRDFHDGSHSIMVRIYNPEKKFYEHPTLINLTQEEAIEHAQKLIKNPPPVEEVLKNWVFIGT